MLSPNQMTLQSFAKDVAHNFTEKVVTNRLFFLGFSITTILLLCMIDILKFFKKLFFNSTQ